MEVERKREEAKKAISRGEKERVKEAKEKVRIERK